MRASVCVALLAGLQAVVGGLAHALPADPAPAAPAPAAPAPTAIQAAPKGALIVALGSTSAEAWSLARSAYREAALIPPVSDATARALVGEPLESLTLEPGEKERVEELAELRRSMQGDPEDPELRRLLWSVGKESNAAAVVVVSRAGESPGPVTARVLDVETGQYSAATLAHGADGWTGAVEALRALVKSPAEPPPAPPPPAPIVPVSASSQSTSSLAADAPSSASDESNSRSWYENPWFWGSTGAVAAVGVTVLVLAVATQGDAGSVTLQGRAPQ